MNLVFSGKFSRMVEHRFSLLLNNLIHFLDKVDFKVLQRREHAKTLLKHFPFGGQFRSLEVVRPLEGQTIDLLLLLYSLGS